MKATAGSCAFGGEERPGWLLTAVASKDFSGLFTHQQQSGNGGTPLWWFRLLPQLLCFRLNETF